ncbi:uncharacterized protein TNCV_2736201 [Trichonephila clavipes]|nr:uncharacterized protein TNCV_2736201 [Trichonephila clavipes]
MGASEVVRHEHKKISDEVFIKSVVDKCNVYNKCSKLRSSVALDCIGGVIGVQRCQVFHAHVQQLWIFEQRDLHLSQVESHKQDSSDIPRKSNRGSINWEIGVAKGSGPLPPIYLPPSKRGIQVSAHFSVEGGWRPIMLKPHAVTNGDWNNLQ